MVHAEIYKNVYSRVAHVNIEVGTNEFKKKNENLSYNINFVLQSLMKWKRKKTKAKYIFFLFLITIYLMDCVLVVIIF